MCMSLGFGVVVSGAAPFAFRMGSGAVAVTVSLQYSRSTTMGDPPPDTAFQYHQWELEESSFLYGPPE